VRGGASQGDHLGWRRGSDDWAGRKKGEKRGRDAQGNGLCRGLDSDLVELVTLSPWMRRG